MCQQSAQTRESARNQLHTRVQALGCFNGLIGQQRNKRALARTCRAHDDDNGAALSSSIKKKLDSGSRYRSYDVTYSGNSLSDSIFVHTEPSSPGAGLRWLGEAVKEGANASAPGCLWALFDSCSGERVERVESAESEFVPSRKRGGSTRWSSLGVVGAGRNEWPQLAPLQEPHEICLVVEGACMLHNVTPCPFWKCENPLECRT